MEPGMVCLEASQPLYHEHSNGSTFPPSNMPKAHPITSNINASDWSGMATDAVNLQRATVCNNATHEWRLLVWRHVCDALLGGAPTWQARERLDSVWLGHHGAAIVLEFVERGVTHGGADGSPWPLPSNVSLRLLNRRTGPPPLGFDGWAYPLAPAA